MCPLTDSVVYGDVQTSYWTRGFYEDIPEFGRDFARIWLYFPGKFCFDRRREGGHKLMDTKNSYWLPVLGYAELIENNLTR